MRRPLSFLVTCACLVALSVSTTGCKSEAEKAAEAERKAAGAEARRVANLSIDEHEANCEKDNAEGCAALATAFQIGEDRPADEKKAQEFFEKACTLGHGRSCLDAADPYLGSKDWAKAEPLLDAGCKAEFDDACTRLVSVQQELAKAAKPSADGAEVGAPAEDDEASERARLLAEIEAAEDDG